VRRRIVDRGTQVRDELGRRVALGRSIASRVVHHPANRHRPRRALARAMWWQARKRVWPRPVDVDFEGFTLRCHPDSQSASNVWYFTPRFDPVEMTFLDRYLRPGDHVLDIGANIGTYTLFAAARVAPGGRITAFEPEPRNAGRLRENVAINHLEGRVDVHAVAVADRPGTVAFLADRDVSNGLAASDDPRGETIEVPAVRLDDVVEAHPGLAVAKLDVEGAEGLALDGARNLLAAGRPAVWITEVIATQLRWFGTTTDDLVEQFAAHGYEPCSIDPVDGGLRWRAPVVKGNVFFVARSAAAEVEARLQERGQAGRSGGPQPPRPRRRLPQLRRRR
jgi:FkbM family methyltransferase